MKNNQKVFANVFLIGLLVILFGIAGYSVWSKKSTPSPTDETTNLKTYTDTKYGFEIRYPSTWFQSIRGPNLVLGTSDLRINGDPPTIDIEAFEGYTKLENNGSGDIERSLDFKKDCTTINFADVLAYDCLTKPDSLYSGKTQIFLYHSGILFAIYDNIDSEVSHKILSTFKFTEPIVDKSEPAICIQDPEAIPLISSLSNSSFSIGDTLKIHGCNLRGFEGDKNVWIENDKGFKGILYGVRNDSNENIQITLTSPICQTDNSYSGLPCKASLALTSGTYKIYAIPWGKKSNEVSITIK